MNYHVVITENGTEKILIIDSYQKPNGNNQGFEALAEHLVLANPHNTNLQQVLTKQGIAPLIGELKIGSTDMNENLLTVLKNAIYFVVNGAVQHTNIDINGFYHVTEAGQIVEIDNGGIRLTDNGNTISINFDGTITGLKESQLFHSAATRGYVESLALGLNPHSPVKIMLEKGVDLYSFIQQGSGVGKTLTATQNGRFDYQGVNFELGDRIGLLSYGNQRIDAGIYDITTLGDENTAWVLTRSADFDGSSTFETKQADVIFVQEGRFAKCMFIETQKGSEPNTGNLIIDTDLVTWELFHKPQDLIFEQGLEQIGQNISVKPDTTTGETIIPVSISSNGVGVQKSIITDIAESKKIEANEYALQLSQGNTTYTNQQITSVRNLILNPIIRPSLFPQFFLLNGQVLQNYSDYLFLDNAYRSGNDGGLNSNNCLPFMMPETGALVGISIYIGAVAVGGTYVPNTIVNVNFQLREMAVAGSILTHSFTIPIQGNANTIGSGGNLPASNIQMGGGTVGINIPLYNSRLYGIKFIHTLNSPTIASTIKNVVVVLEIKVS